LYSKSDYESTEGAAGGGEEFFSFPRIDLKRKRGRITLPKTENNHTTNVPTIHAFNP
jgi:hypothetical protein